MAFLRGNRFHMLQSADGAVFAPSLDLWHCPEEGSGSLLIWVSFTFPNLKLSQLSIILNIK